MITLDSKKTCAVFSCIGLGDGLISLVLSQNLAKRVERVDTYHPFLHQASTLFPSLPLLPRKEGFAFLEEYDYLFFIFERDGWMRERLEYALKHFPEKTIILNPIATPKNDYPYWEVGKFNGTKPFVDNLVTYCKEQLGIEEATKSNGLQLPESTIVKRLDKRIVLHPTSSRKGKNWGKQQFIRLSKRLKASGYEPVFILTKDEKTHWPEVDTPEFTSLIELTQFIAESGAMIGNDSGIGHLASLVNLPTLTICRSKMAADFWRPAWTQGEVIIPPKWIPNLKGARLRDKHWQKFVPVMRVYEEFRKLAGV